MKFMSSGQTVELRSAARGWTVLVNGAVVGNYGDKGYAMARGIRRASINALKSKVSGTENGSGERR